MLEGLGCEATAASNGGEAIRLCETREFEVLFTDCVMPGEIDGPALAARLTVKHPSLAVLFTSGNRKGTDPLPAEGAHFLSKPYTEGELAQALSRSLGS